MLWFKKKEITYKDLPKRLQEAVKLAQKYKKELAIANKVQHRLLNMPLPKIKGIKIAKKFIPAEMMGGDFYTFLTENFESFTQKSKTPGIIEYIDKEEQYFSVIVGDVAGHGISSSLIMALTSGILNEIGRNTSSPAQILAHANNNILDYIENSEIPFVTAFYANLNLAKKTLTFARAGHPSPLVIHKKTNEIKELYVKGTFLGMYHNETYEEKTIQLSSGDRVYFYTDGLTEARNPSHEFFGQERFKELLIKNQKNPIEKALENIFKTVAKFTGDTPLRDDQTLVILELR
jgi:phosphoserine phosphatase RsbU/P